MGEGPEKGRVKIGKVMNSLLYVEHLSSFIPLPIMTGGTCHTQTLTSINKCRKCAIAIFYHFVNTCILYTLYTRTPVVKKISPKDQQDIIIVNSNYQSMIEALINMN